MSSSDKADGSQQLQHKGLGPVAAPELLEREEEQQTSRDAMTNQLVS